MEPKFNNIPNKCYNINGKEVWHSRSPAIVGVIIATIIETGKIYVLCEKRTNTMPVVPGRWVLPCGYIDWNENGWDALRREVYEETGFLIDDYKKYLYYKVSKEPYFVKTEINENSQNIVLNYRVFFKFSKKDFPKHIEKNKNEEVAKVKWIPLEDVLSKKYNMAFEHEERIEKAIINDKVIW